MVEFDFQAHSKNFSKIDPEFQKANSLNLVIILMKKIKDESIEKISSPNFYWFFNNIPTFHHPNSKAQIINLPLIDNKFLEFFLLKFSRGRRTSIFSSPQEFSTQFFLLILSRGDWVKFYCDPLLHHVEKIIHNGW